MFARRFAVITLAVIALTTLPTTVVAAPQSAPPGYDAAYCGQSVYLDLHAGDSAQSSACFANTGTVTWVMGAASEVALGICVDTPAPQYYACNVLSPYADWLPNPMARIYGSQVTATIPPGSVTNIFWNVKVPAGTPPGNYYLRGELVLKSTGVPIHAVGYYQLIHIT